MPLSEEARALYSITATPSVSTLLPEEEPDWDAFVERHPHGSPFHLMAWKRTIEETFPYRPYYLTARTASETTGVLPLFLVDNFAVGKALISTPFGVYGGILALDAATRAALHAGACALGAELGVEYIEFRNAFPEQCGGEPNVHRYAAFSQPLAPGEDALMAALPKKTRNMVRKAMKTPFTMRRGVREARRFDEIHSRNMRRLGTPSFPRRYYERLLANFGEMADIREVWLEDELMAASLNLYYKGSMHTYHAAADARSNHLGPNTFMYFENLRWAAEHGFSEFDFGRSKFGTGPFEFKRHWNTVMRELPYEIVLVRRKELPNFSPANPKFGLAIRLWQLLPLWVTRRIGPKLIELFP